MSDVFGLPETQAESTDWLQDNPEPTEPQETSAPEPTTEVAPSEPEQPQERPRDPETGRFIKQEELYPNLQKTEEPAPTEEPTEAPAVEEEAPKVWAGKYNDPEALEKGYRELRSLQRRTAERAKAQEQRAAEVEFQARQMEDAVRRATDYVRQLQQQEQLRLQQAAQQPQRVLYDEDGNQVQLPTPQPVLPPQQQMTPEYVEEMIRQNQVAQAQALQEQYNRQLAYNEAKAAQQDFFERHPEVQKDGTVDEDIANTILALNEAWAPLGAGNVDIRSSEVLDIAYEASRRPALLSVLEKQPHLVDDENGMTLARALATQIDGNTQAPAVPANQPVGRMKPQPNTPVFERGSSPAPAQQSPLDEFDQAVAEYRKTAKARGSDIFFGS